MEWFSGLINITIILNISKGFSVIFFLVIVVSLMLQIARARIVSPKVILNSVVVYLLLGLIFSVFVAFIKEQDPGAFSSQKTAEVQAEVSLDRSIPLYFSFWSEYAKENSAIAIFRVSLFPIYPLSTAASAERA